MQSKKLKNGPAYKYVFHWNPYKEEWAAIPRSEYVAYFNGTAKGVKTGTDINILVTKLK